MDILVAIPFETNSGQIPVQKDRQASLLGAWISYLLRPRLVQAYGFEAGKRRSECRNYHHRFSGNRLFRPAVILASQILAEWLLEWQTQILSSARAGLKARTTFRSQARARKLSA